MDAAILAGISAQARAEAPSECCGILLGHAHAAGLTASAFLPATNAAPDGPAHRYAIAPEALVLAQKEAHHRDLTISGFYHSHPDGPAQWSQDDLAEAHWPGCAYLILGMKNGQVHALNAFLLAVQGPANKSFVPINLKLMPH